MEPGSCPLSDTAYQFLTLFLIALFMDLLLNMCYSAIRFTAFDSEMYEADVHRDNPVSPLNLSVILFASRVFAGIACVLAILVMDSFCVLDTIWSALVVALAAPILIILTEGIFSGIGARHNASIAPKIKIFAQLINAIFKPLYQLYDSFKPATIRKTFLFNQMESRLREWVKNPPESTPLREDERKMVRSILHFADTLTREIMIPRVDMTAIDVDSSLDVAAATVLSSGHSRLPVYDDEIDNIIGVLYAKDLLKVYREDQTDETMDLTLLLRPAVFVPEAKKVGDLLSEMQASGIHMVIVVDEYGGTAGIVSMEDIVEEIVGEIRDEYDESEEELVRIVAENEYSFLGRIDLEDVNEILHTHIPRDAADTLAGFMYSQVGKVPLGDEVILVEGWQFQVEELSGNRIRRVFVKSAEPEAGDEKSEDYKEDDENG